MMKNTIRGVVVFFVVIFSATFSVAGEVTDLEWKPYMPAVNKVATAHAADLGSTAGVLLLVEGAMEANPAGWGLIPLKLALTYGFLPLLPPEQQQKMARGMSSTTYGAVASNLLTLTGVVSGPVAWTVGGVVIVYLVACDNDMLPRQICFFRETTSEKLLRLYVIAEEKGEVLEYFVVTPDDQVELLEEGFQMDFFNGIPIETAPREVVDIVDNGYEVVLNNKTAERISAEGYSFSSFRIIEEKIVVDVVSEIEKLYQDAKERGSLDSALFIFTAEEGEALITAGYSLEEYKGVPLEQAPVNVVAEYENANAADLMEGEWYYNPSPSLYQGYIDEMSLFAQMERAK